MSDRASGNSLVLRQLTDEERIRAFAKGAGAASIYMDTVREMEGGQAYAIAIIAPLTARALRVNLNKAAKALGLKLRWAKYAIDAQEVIVELSEDDDRAETRPRALHRRGIA